MILVTGSTGFVGQNLVNRLGDSSVICLGRSKLAQFGGCFFYGELDEIFDFKEALNGADTVVHLAARVHITKDTDKDPLSAFRLINTAGTLNLAQQAANTGVKRFIFVSSILVNGNLTTCGYSFCYKDTSCPDGDFALSKYEAEIGLKEIAKTTGMEVVIIRPPLVYGPGVKANFASMMNLAKKNLPLPLGSIKNKRSLVAIDNLVDLIITCIHHPKAANQTFLVSDDHDVSTTELLEELTRAAGKKPRLIPVPMKLIQIAANLLGKKAIADRLCGSLQIDISYTKDTLNWKPPVSFEKGIARCFEKV